MTLTDLGRSTRRNLVAGVSTSDDGATIIALRGEADVATLPVLVDVLARAIAEHPGAVVIDLEETEFVDSATIRAFGRAWQILRAGGGRLAFRSPSSQAAGVLAYYGLDHLIVQATTNR